MRWSFRRNVTLPVATSYTVFLLKNSDDSGVRLHSSAFVFGIDCVHSYITLSAFYCVSKYNPKIKL